MELLVVVDEWVDLFNMYELLLGDVVFVNIYFDCIWVIIVDYIVEVVRWWLFFY